MQPHSTQRRLRSNLVVKHLIHGPRRLGTTGSAHDLGRHAGDGHRPADERAQGRIDLASAGTETRCDAAVRFTSVTGRVITTTVTDAFPSEFSGSGRSRTIDLRYDRNDPAQPFKQSNYMPAGTFISLLASGAVVLLLGYWGVARARRLADRTVRNRPRRTT